MKSIVIVGAGLAGLRAAQALRRRGYDGRLTVAGEEAHPPYDRPPLSKQILTGEWRLARTALLKPEDDALQIEWRLGARATALDLHTKTLHTQKGALQFDACIIATGCAARALPLPGAQLPGITTLRRREDAAAIRAAMARAPRVAIVGGGFIGAEVAAAARAGGLSATIIEALPALMRRGGGASLGEFAAALHRENGVQLKLGARVEGFAGGAHVAGVRLAGGETVPADLVVVGVGAAPSTAWLQGSGLELRDGVLCDSTCRSTRAPFVAAAGDCARWTNPRYRESMRLEHWTNAAEQAEHAAGALLAGGGASAFAPVPFVWSDQFGCKLQIAGRIDEGGRSEVVEGSFSARRFVMLFERRGQLRGVLGANRPRLVMRYRALLREGASWEQALRAS